MRSMTHWQDIIIIVVPEGAVSEDATITRTSDLTDQSRGDRIFST
jgi:hypothetical protein